MKTYLRYKVLNVVDIKEIIALEYLDFEGKYKNYVEKHDFWELCYVESGTVFLDMDNEKHKLFENEIMLIAPNTIHSYFSDSGNETKVFVICFESSSRLLKSMGEIRFFADAEKGESLKRIISECKKTFCFDEDGAMKLLENPAFGGVQAILVQLEYLLISLLRTLSTEKNREVVFLNADTFYESITDVIIEFLKANVEKKLTLKEICAKVNYSSSFLCKKFKAQTGETMIEFFNRLKIEEAKKRLVDTEKAVAAISLELGFSEVKYFGAIFKKNTGLSPTEYRKKNKIGGKL